MSKMKNASTQRPANVLYGDRGKRKCRVNMTTIDMNITKSIPNVTACSQG